MSYILRITPVRHEKAGMVRDSWAASLDCTQPGIESTGLHSIVSYLAWTLMNVVID